MTDVKLRPVTFSFDTGENFKGFTDGTYWNGFINVWVKPEVRDAIVAHFIAVQDCPDGIADTKALPIGENGLVCLARGYATQLVPEPEPSRELVLMLAGAFIAELHQEIGPDNLKLAADRNDGEDPAICHSQDFCDANMVMLAALELIGHKVNDVTVDLDEGTLGQQLWNAAWAEAKKIHFLTRTFA